MASLDGTGAKYTVIHVHRSADFCRGIAGEEGFIRRPEIKRGAEHDRNVCTGINAALDAIPFQNGVERIAGFALGSADLLGQMAAGDYVEKLPLLYAEFAEAARHNQDKKSFVSQFSERGGPAAENPGVFGAGLRPAKTRAGFRRCFWLPQRPLSFRTERLSRPRRGEHGAVAARTGGIFVGRSVTCCVGMTTAASGQPPMDVRAERREEF